MRKSINHNEQTGSINREKHASSCESLLDVGVRECDRNVWIMQETKKKKNEKTGKGEEIRKTR